MLQWLKSSKDDDGMIWPASPIHVARFDGRSPPSQAVRSSREGGPWPVCSIHPGYGSVSFLRFCAHGCDAGENFLSSGYRLTGQWVTVGVSSSLSVSEKLDRRKK